jgi:hypothetical protein
VAEEAVPFRVEALEAIDLGRQLGFGEPDPAGLGDERPCPSGFRPPTGRPALRERGSRVLAEGQHRVARRDVGGPVARFHGRGPVEGGVQIRWTLKRRHPNQQYLQHVSCLLALGAVLDQGFFLVGLPDSMMESDKSQIANPP